MVLWKYWPKKRGEEAAFAIAVFQPLSQMHLDIRKGIHLLSPCNNTAAIPRCLFDGKLTEVTERRLTEQLLALPGEDCPCFCAVPDFTPGLGHRLKSWEGETEAQSSSEACVWQRLC